MDSLVLFLVGIGIFLAGYANRQDEIYIAAGLAGLIFFSLFALLAAIGKKRNEQKPMATRKRR
ncbi:hypothetical protein K0B04_02245 [Patescibacteria group bacterium]|nr:hypothetical protein [Patescibacteria group bacterium]